MTKLNFIVCSLVLAAASAFAPVSPIRTVKGTPVALNMAEDMYWEGDAPPSKVLGPIMSKMSSATLGVLSLALLFACVYSVAQSSVLVQEPGNVESGAWVKWYYILGSFCGPISWGTHVACWIQRKNGM